MCYIVLGVLFVWVYVWSICLLPIVYMFNLCVSIGQQGCRDWTDSFGHPSLPVLTPHTQDDSLETPCTQPRAW